MKSLILASTVALSASTVQADDVIPNLPQLGFGGEIEYSVEDSQFAMEVGPNASFGSFGVSSRLQATATDELSLDFTGVEVEGSYILRPEVSLYSTISTTDELKYDNIKVGVRFSF